MSNKIIDLQTRRAEISNKTSGDSYRSSPAFHRASKDAGTSLLPPSGKTKTATRVISDGITQIYTEDVHAGSIKGLKNRFPAATLIERPTSQFTHDRPSSPYLVEENPRSMDLWGPS